MALSDADLHWIPMNRSKFDQLRKMFDVKEQSKTAPCDKCTSPRIRYTSAENVSALAQIRALLRPVDANDDSSTSSRSRTTSEDSMELRSRTQQNGLVVIDPLLCSKNLTFINDNVLAKADGTDKRPLCETVCETIGETTENVSVGEVTKREPSANSDSNNRDRNNNNCNNNNCNGSLSPERNGIIHENCEVIKSSDHSGITENNHIANHNDSNSHLENGSTDSLIIDEEIHNNNVFLALVNDEAEVLSREREYFMKVIEEATSVSEEAGGRVMAGCGKANLLLTSKFKQYRGLCYDYEKTTRQMTSDDMQGFWDLILLQVDDVKKMFTALRNLEQNKWSIPKSPMPKKKSLDLNKSSSTPVKKKPREKTPAQKARDDARRKMLAAKKLEMRQKLKEGGSLPEIIIT